MINGYLGVITKQSMARQDFGQGKEVLCDAAGQSSRPDAA